MLTEINMVHSCRKCENDYNHMSGKNNENDNSRLNEITYYIFFFEGVSHRDYPFSSLFCLFRHLNIGVDMYRIALHTGTYM